MCLLGSVSFWNEERIVCHADSHHDAENPLRVGGRLDVLCGVEYAAQAMAVHGGLIAAGARPAAGYLASLRDVRCEARLLDERAGGLVIMARRLLGQAGRAIYEFEITAQEMPMMQGRVALVLNDEAQVAP